MDIHEFTLTNGGDALFTIYDPVVHNGTALLDAIVQQVDIAHRPGRVGVARARPHPAARVLRDGGEQRVLRRVPHQLDPGAHPRPRADLRARHVGDLSRSSARAAGSCGRSAARRATSSSAPGRASGSSTTRSCTAAGCSMFDDQAGPPQKAPSSRGARAAARPRRHRATVVRSLQRPEHTSAQSEGSNQLLPDGGRFVGFGAEPWFTQFSASGRVVFDARLPVDDGTYRAYRFPWRAKPATKPVAVVQDGARLRELERRDGRRALAGARGGKVVASAAQTDFETRIAVPGAGAVRRAGARRAAAACSRRGAVVSEQPNLILLITDQQRAPQHWPDDPALARRADAQRRRAAAHRHELQPGVHPRARCARRAREHLHRHLPVAPRRDADDDPRRPVPRPPNARDALRDGGAARRVGRGAAGAGGARGRPRAAAAAAPRAATSPSCRRASRRSGRGCASSATTSR